MHNIHPMKDSCCCSMEYYIPIIHIREEELLGNLFPIMGTYAMLGLTKNLVPTAGSTCSTCSSYIIERASQIPRCSLQLTLERSE